MSNHLLPYVREQWWNDFESARVKGDIDSCVVAIVLAVTSAGISVDVVTF